MKSALGIDETLPGEEDGSFNTLGGFTMNELGRIPVEADSFEAAGYRFEVIDMDKNRVDKVLVRRIIQPGTKFE
jgi:putative hemolysin